MTIKVQCVCGSKFAFDVEPVNGVMPFRVNCPTCNADGTEAANQILAQTAAETPQPRLRMQAAPMAAEPAAPAGPLPAIVTKRGESIRRIHEERQGTNAALFAIGGGILFVLALLGVYAWYCLIGSHPHLKYDTKLPSPEWTMQQLPGGKVLLANPYKVILRDFKANHDVWTANLPQSTDMEVGPPKVLIDKQSVWVCPGSQVFRLDMANGDLKATVPIAGHILNFTPTESSILVVSETDETGRIAMRIDRATSETSSQIIEVPRRQEHPMPDELPPNVAPTAGVLMSQEMEEQKFNKPLTAVSSQFFSAGDNLIELRVTLLEAKVTYVKSIKDRGPSLINGNLTAGTSAAAVAQEVFNDIKRDRTGGVKPVDESRYQVRLRRWIGDHPVEWREEVIGVPSFFALPTVDLITAGKELIVFDKQNNKLFATPLSYPIAPRFANENEGSETPAVEHAGMLYFFDAGVLTALELPGGQVHWRMPSVGVSLVQFDDKGMMYVDSTEASLEEIQYSDQIRFQSAPTVLIKADPKSGKILWQVQKKGQRCFISGKYLYSVSAESGGMGLTMGLAEAVNAPRPGSGTFFKIYRLDPKTGEEIWRYSQNGAPEEIEFQENWFLTRTADDLQTWSYLSF